MMSDIEWRWQGVAAEAVLMRPAARNALTLEMVENLAHGLRQANDDPGISTIIVRSELDGFYCAGGDMRRIRNLVLEEKFAQAEAFFEAEYALNLSISRSKKPVVAIVDGICIGGGLGISVHGICIATMRAQFAMPEGLLGWFPDVGASYFLSRMQHGLGMYIGLTARWMSAVDAYKAGLVVALIQVEELPDLLADLRAGETVCEIRQKCASLPLDWSGQIEISRLEKIFTKLTLNEIFQALEKEGVWGAAADQDMRMASPQSLALTFDLITKASGLNLSQCLDAEMRAASAQLRHPDFIEGVRAVLIDKDRSPRWLERK